VDRGDFVVIKKRGRPTRRGTMLGTRTRTDKKSPDGAVVWNQARVHLEEGITIWCDTRYVFVDQDA
jgi:hypothetical protein